MIIDYLYSFQNIIKNKNFILFAPQLIQSNQNLINSLNIQNNYHSYNKLSNNIMLNHNHGKKLLGGELIDDLSTNIDKLNKMIVDLNVDLNIDKLIEICQVSIELINFLGELHEKNNNPKSKEYLDKLQNQIANITLSLKKYID